MTTERTGPPEVTGEAFGFGPEEDTAFLSDHPEPTPPQAPAPTAPEGQVPPPAEPQALPEAQPPVTGQPATEPQPGAPEAGSEVPGEPAPEQTPAERLYAGKFKTPEDLEAGYSNARRIQMETAQRAQRIEAEARQREQLLLEQLQQAAATLAQLDQGAVPTYDPSRLFTATELDQLRQLPPERQQQIIAQRQGQSRPPQIDPTQVQAQIEQQAQERARQVIAEQQEAQRTAEVQAAITTFRAAHPDAMPGTETDMMMSAIIDQLVRDEDGTPNPDNFQFTPESLEIVYQLANEPRLHQAVMDLYVDPNPTMIEFVREAMDNPRLYTLAKAQPTLMDTPEGRQIMREQAGIAQVVGQAVAAAQPPTQEQMRRAAAVEGPSAGAPVDGAPRPQADFMDEMAAAYNGTKPVIPALGV